MAFDKLSDCDAVTDLEDVLLPGTLLLGGQYRISSFLNSGGFGITYLAKDKLNRDVVLKECFVPIFCRRSRAEVVARSDNSKIHLLRAIAGFIAEARATAALSHPNVVRVKQVFEANNTAYMVLDYIQGHDLLEIIDERKAVLTPDQIVSMARKLVSALGHIHDRGVLHCDISPDNICVRADGEPVLIDFGSARQMVAGVVQKHAGFSMVKDGYSPHELYVPDGACGPWSDIYALGASLYHAVSGAAPADCQTRIVALSSGQPDPLRSLARTVTGYPPGFLASIDKALSVQPASRHQTARDWLATIAPSQITARRNIALMRRLVVTPNPVRQMDGRVQTA